MNAPFHSQRDDHTEVAGWLIRAKTPGFLPQDYLATLSDPEEALRAVRLRVGAAPDDAVDIIGWMPEAAVKAAGAKPGDITAS